MKKALPVLLLAFTLVFCPVRAEKPNGRIVAPFPAGSAEAALTARIAESLGLGYVPAEGNASMDSESRGETVNLMLSEPGTILCDTQAALIASLNGYTDEDLRSAMVPVCRVARCPLYLVMDAGAAQEKGITGSESFLAYIRENPYDDSLILARRVEADPLDRAAFSLSDSFTLLADSFLPSEIPEMLRSGEAALAVYTEADLNASAEEDLLVLFTLGRERTQARPDIPALPEAGTEACPEPALCLMAGTQESAERLEEIARTVSEADLAADCLSAGLVFDPLSGEALTEEVSAAFADYIEYMTAEGLMFYEQ